MREVKFLKGERFDKESNLDYRVPWEKIPKKVFVNSSTNEEREVLDVENATNLIEHFISHHKQHQVPRLKELARYMRADNNINYRPKKNNENKADNRISSDFANFIVTFNRGVIVGNPVVFNNEDEDLMAEIDAFNIRTNMDYHNQILCDELFSKGRAYELLFRSNGQEYVGIMDSEKTFVVYDDNKDPQSLFAVNYYSSEYIDETSYYADVYLPIGIMYTLESQDGTNYTFNPDLMTYTYYDGIQVNEYRNNEARLSDFERVLSNIDAYDLSQSELANYQENTNNAILVIEGNPQTGKGKPGSGNSPTDVAAAMKESGILVMGEQMRDLNGKAAGASPKAYYLISSYDSTGAEAYKKRLVSDILRYSMVIDFTDENMGGNSTGVGLQFKSWGNNNQRKTKERLLEKGFMRRLRILGSAYARRNLKSQEEVYELVNSTTIKFTANMPQSDEELKNVIKDMKGVVSDYTVYQLAERLTGVSPKDEEIRIEEQTKARMALIDDMPEKVMPGDDGEGMDTIQQEAGSSS